MAVLVEAISVIVRRDAIEQKYAGGWDAFVDAVPNATLCTDDEIARVGFMAPSGVDTFIDRLERHGLVFLDNGRAIDLTVVDQQRGLTTDCDWLEFAKLPYKGEERVSTCWFFDDPRTGDGIHMHELSIEMATPAGWKFEGSLSQNFTFVPEEDLADRLVPLREENGVHVCLDLDTGKEVYIGDTKK